jgi:thiamine biosynthesis lipoprotein
MSPVMGLIAALAGLSAGTSTENAECLQRYAFSQVEMAAEIDIILYAPSKDLAALAAEAAYARFSELNRVLSDYDPQSEVRRLCDASAPGKPVRVSDDLWRVLVRAQEVAAKSQGAFDVTVGQVVRLWRRARRQEEFPDAERLTEARHTVGYRHLILHPEDRSVELLRRGVRIDLGGIAMGYAVDEAAKVVRGQGITRLLIDGSGDILAGDPPPDSPGWVIGVPGIEADSPPVAFVRLANRGLTTSGDAVQFVEIDGRRYSHIVDPRTGVPLTDHSCVTVVADDAVTADALASAVSVLGPGKGLQLIEATPGAAASILRAPGGKTERHESRRWAELPKVRPEPTVPTLPPPS